MHIIDKEKVIDTIYVAIEELNNQLVSSMNALGKTPETLLFGRGAELDSLTLVSLVVEVEQTIQDYFGVTLTLANEQALSRKNSPFRTVSTLADYVVELLEQGSDYS